MKYLTSILLVLLTIGFVSCTSDTTESEPAGTEVTTEAGDMSVTTYDEMQVVEITVETMGYTPSTIELKAGVPARLVVTRETESNCAKQIQFPDFGISVTDLPLNEAVSFDILPSESGEFTFACGMNMMKGTVVVKA